MSIDREIRDYYFDLLKTASPASKEHLLHGFYGLFEGLAASDPWLIIEVMSRIQRNTDYDHGIR